MSLYSPNCAAATRAEPGRKHWCTGCDCTCHHVRPPAARMVAEYEAARAKRNPQWAQERARARAERAATAEQEQA